MKKEYNSPELDLISFKLNSIMTASEYVPQPEDPTRDGDEGGEGEL